MSNSYYNAGSFPATGTPATSASMRAELALISGGFDRLPALSGNANKLVLINGAETGMTVLTPPAGDLVGTTATQTLTNKTISGTFTGSLTGAASLNVLKAGDTMTGNLVINTGVDSRVLLQSSGTTQGQIQTTGALVRFASNNALPLVLSTNGVDRATLDDVGNITFGSASATGVFKVQGNNTNDLAVFESTDASASAAPDVVLYRNSASPAVSDQIGVLIWRGKDSGGADQQYARLGAEITDPTAGSEDADLWFETTGAGVAAERMRLNAAGLSLASTSDLTLNKGTANGILYLNGSKVATSGSALTFDGTNLGVGGSLGTNAGRVALTLNATTDTILSFGRGGSLVGYILQDATGQTFYNGENTFQRWYVNSAEQMRLTSTGLGIGTSLPGARLNVVGSPDATFNSQLLIGNSSAVAQKLAFNPTVSSGIAGLADGALAFYANGANTERMRLDSSGNLGIGTSSLSARLDVVGGVGIRVNEDGAGTKVIQIRSNFAGIAPAINVSTNDPLLFQTNNTERMRLDPSGNLGLGVTPSAWNTGYRALDMGSGALMAQASGADVYLTANAFFSTGGSWTYRQTSSAGRYTVIGNTHSWHTAPSGTAGTAISFTQAMTLDASGNLGVGLTSPVGRITIKGQSSATALQQLAFQYHGSASNYLAIGLQNGTGQAQIMAGSGASLLFYTNSDLSSTNERARITDAGNQIDYQPAESAQNTSVTLTAANLQARIITSNAAVTLTLPTGTSLEGYTTGMATDTAFEVTFIATTANAITIAANGNTTVGNLTVSGNTSGTFRFRKTATNTFTVYRIS